MELASDAMRRVSNEEVAGKEVMSHALEKQLEMVVRGSRPRWELLGPLESIGRRDSGAWQVRIADIREHRRSRARG